MNIFIVQKFSLKTEHIADIGETYIDFKNALTEESTYEKTIELHVNIVHGGNYKHIISHSPHDLMCDLEQIWTTT
jgi:hypothetical protein